MSAHEFYAKDAIQAKFPMLTPLEHAIMRQTPKEQWHYLSRSDLGMDETFMELINANRLTTGDTELTRAIRLDKSEKALQRFIEIVGYKDGSVELSRNWCKTHTYILINICFANKSTECLKIFLKHPFIRDCLKEMLVTPEYYDVRGQTNIFGYVDPTHRSFDVAFIEDPLILETIRSNPDNERHLFDELVYACIRGRHYDGIEILRNLNDKLTNSSLARVTELPCGKPVQKFAELCLEGYNYQKFIKRINEMEITNESVDVPYLLNPLIDIFRNEPIMELLIHNALRYNLRDEVLALLLNAHRGDAIGKIIQQINGWGEPFKFIPSQIKGFVKSEREALLTAVQNDDINGLLSVFIHDSDVTETRIEQAFLFALIYNADKCVRTMSSHPEMRDIISRIKTHGKDIIPERMAWLFYGALDYLYDSCFESYESNDFSFLIPASAYSSLMSQLYVLNSTIKDIPDDRFNDFRYMVTLGSIIHLNMDIYEWSISELYDGSEEEFLSDMYLRTQLLRDEYRSTRHTLIRVIEAFMLYRKCIEFAVENEL
jgi:hypothetical protein